MLHSLSPLSLVISSLFRSLFLTPVSLLTENSPLRSYLLLDTTGSCFSSSSSVYTDYFTFSPHPHCYLNSWNSFTFSKLPFTQCLWKQSLLTLTCILSFDVHTIPRSEYQHFIRGGNGGLGKLNALLKITLIVRLEIQIKYASLQSLN